MNRIPSPAAPTMYLCALAAKALVFSLICNVTASPEAPRATPKPTPAAKTKEAAESAKKTIARNPRLAGTVATSLGESIYASRPVTADSALAQSRPGVTVWRGWLVGLDGNPIRGQYAPLPDGRLVDMSFEIQWEYNAQHGIPHPRKTKTELEAYRLRLERDWEKEVTRREKADEKITPEQIYLWRRMGRPWGAPFRNFIEDRARYGDPSLGQ